MSVCACRVKRAELRLCRRETRVRKKKRERSVKIDDRAPSSHVVGKIKARLHDVSSSGADSFFRRSVRRGRLSERENRERREASTKKRRRNQILDLSRRAADAARATPLVLSREKKKEGGEKGRERGKRRRTRRGTRRSETTRCAIFSRFPENFRNYKARRIADTSGSQ